ncbi:ankyrin repeat domain containing protein [Perkinsus marinus ATCC 50983]|uniref:Ankyrin repeat domain containing protein n=1 Tax=Perkinsus marinus (strain ATCC 50983 / TXsc) TaxID=423536 RepID=C5KBW3_PERM5|nr:ankyrin repeat domain containing protein [Perkinsus marinus ATCC 50983]EER17994.1 ankyrin repeat domain containing protein [Perkinsus marinus ATCC 50983]|eukprot:XP_002786198.1 ankyrin repeat domain containing protein [Perkinsus marinus ATCC 50983]
MSSTNTPSANESENPSVATLPDLQGLYDSPDVDDKIDETGCSESYNHLEDCIVENDRDWRKCQEELIDFRKCMRDHGRLAAEGFKIDGKRAIELTKDSKTRRVIKSTKPLNPDVRTYVETQQLSEVNCGQRIVRADPAQVTMKNIYGDTALHYACKGTDIEIVEILLQNSADVHAQNKFGQFPIDHAAKKSPEIFSALKDYGALWDKKKKCGLPPEGMLNSELTRKTMQVVAESQNVNDAAASSRTGDAGRQLFKDQRKKFSSFSASYTGLQYACVKKDAELVREILKSEGVDVNAQNAYGDAALHYAVQGGLMDVVKDLISHKADLDIQNDFGQTPLHNAARVPIMPLLAPRLLRETEKKSPAPLGSPTLELPDSHKKLITRKEAEVEEQGMMSFSPLMYACVRGEEQKVREILREAGEQSRFELLKQQNAYGDTALHYAAQQGNRDIVSFLLDANADPDVRNRYGLTPLHHAASVTASATSAAGYGRIAAAVEVIRELLERGADKYLEGLVRHFYSPFSPVRMHRGRTTTHCASETSEYSRYPATSRASVAASKTAIDPMTRLLAESEGLLAVTPEIHRLPLDCRVDSHQQQPEFLRNLRERCEAEGKRQKMEKRIERRKRHEAMIAREKRRGEWLRQQSVIRERIENEESLRAERRRVQTAITRQIRKKLQSGTEQGIDINISQELYGNADFEGEESEGSGDATQPFPIEATHARKIIHKILVPPKIQHRVQLQATPSLPEKSDLAVELPNLFPGLRGV